MTQLMETLRDFVAKQRPASVDYRRSAGRAVTRYPRAIDMFRSPMANRFYPDWFALRMWEDDGGGQLR